MDLELYNFFKMKKKQLVCDRCHCSFEMEKELIKRQWVKNENKQDMLIHYFTCPYCQEIYIMAIIDGKISRCMDKINKLEKKISCLKRREKNLELLQEYESKREAIRQQMLSHERVLNNKYNKHFYLRNEEVDR